MTRELLALSTIFRPENVFTDLKKAIEVRQVTGLALDELAVFRPERLALHETLVRITADYEVPDPATASIPSLGINFRHMVQTILARLQPSRADLIRGYDEMRRAISRLIEDELADAFPKQIVSGATRATADFKRASWRWFHKPGRRHDLATARETDWEQDERVLRDWSTKASAHQDPVRAATFRALVKAASAIRSRTGRILNRSSLLPALAIDLACNDHGADLIGRMIDPWIRRIAQEAGFRPLPVHDRPVMMIIKGASASGKSTMRPLQRDLAATMGLQWRDFALISPDIWRKVLLDFESLGRHRKYAGMLTGHELEIIDQKLAAYLRRKGEQNLLSHLLIDRFRFDTFALESEENKFLVSHFASLVCYVFMITPPHETVERAWRRGLEVGRYKAVDDLLAHNIEAFTGMQKILFGRAVTPTPGLHYEFLDNDVPRGSPPLTVAFGWAGEINIFDIGRMLDVCRYQNIIMDAKGPAEVYPDPAPPLENYLEFLERCVRCFPQVNFADRQTGRIYLHLEHGRVEWVDHEVLESMLTDDDSRAALDRVVPGARNTPGGQAQRQPVHLMRDRFPTLGRWGKPDVRGPSAPSPPVE